MDKSILGGNLVEHVFYREGPEGCREERKGFCGGLGFWMIKKSEQLMFHIRYKAPKGRHITAQGVSPVVRECPTNKKSSERAAYPRCFGLVLFAVQAPEYAAPSGLFWGVFRYHRVSTLCFVMSPFQGFLIMRVNAMRGKSEWNYLFQKL